MQQSSKQNPLTKPLNVFLLAAVSCLLCASATPAIKKGYVLMNLSESDTWSMILFAGIRFTLAGIWVLLFGSLLEKRPLIPKMKTWGHVTMIGLTETVIQFVFFYIGVSRASGVHTSILNGSGTLWSIMFSCYLFRYEKMNFPKALGCILGFGGIILMNLGGESGGFSLTGEGFILISTVGSAFASGLMKRFSSDESPILLTAWQYLIGGLIMLAAGLLGGGRIRLDSMGAVGILAYLSALSAVSYAIWSTLLKHNPVSSVMIYGFMNPMFGVALSALLLGEGAQAFSANTLLALALVCAGIISVNRFGNRVKSGTKVQK